jgi:hypothetical protein
MCAVHVAICSLGSKLYEALFAEFKQLVLDFLVGLNTKILRKALALWQQRLSGGKFHGSGQQIADNQLKMLAKPSRFEMRELSFHSLENEASGRISDEAVRCVGYIDSRVAHKLFGCRLAAASAGGGYIRRGWIYSAHIHLISPSAQVSNGDEKANSRPSIIRAPLHMK